MGQSQIGAPLKDGFTLAPGDAEGTVEMLVVEAIRKIRRLHEIEDLGIKAICRPLGVSRKAVRSGATEFRHDPLTADHAAPPLRRHLATIEAARTA